MSTPIQKEHILLTEKHFDRPHPRWNTVKELKEALSEFDDNYFVMIRPHKYLIEYPFYIFSLGGNCVELSLYDDSFLRRPFKIWLDGIKERTKGIIRQVKNEFK